MQRLEWWPHKNNLKTPTTEVGDFCSAQKNDYHSLSEWYSWAGFSERGPESCFAKSARQHRHADGSVCFVYRFSAALGIDSANVTTIPLFFSDFKWTLATSGDNPGKTTLKTQKEGSQNSSSKNQNWHIIDGGTYTHNGCDSRWTVTVFVLYILLHSCTLGSHYTVGSSLCLH